MSTFQARWFRGEAPVGEAAEAQVGPGGVTIRSASGFATWPLESLRQAERPRRGEPVRLEREGAHEMLVCADHGILDAIRQNAPAATGRIQTARRTPVLAVALALLLAIGALVAVLVMFGIPALARGVASSVPVEWERRFGAAVIASAAPESRRIADARVTGAIDRIVQRLAAAGPRSEYAFHVVVVDASAVNAFAAPGGHLAVHRGLLEFARTPEEVAGVLAHEMAHVTERHVTQALLQNASLGILVAIAVGDAGGPAIELARGLGELSYSREAELDADSKGLERLIAAQVDPRGMADFLARMEADQRSTPATLEFLSTHPAAPARARRLRERIAAIVTAPRPLLNTEEWTRLRAALSERAGGSPATGAPR